MIDAPVKIISRTLACENQKFHVYFDHVLDHAGFETPRYLVVSPKHKTADMVSGVAILPIVDGQVGLIRIYRPALRDYSWEIPHGFVDEQDEREAARRELEEETGLVVAPENFRSLGCIAPDTGLLAARVSIYVAENCQMTGEVQGELGLRELRLFSIPELERMILTSEIQDAFTISAWCKYRMGGR